MLNKHSVRTTAEVVGVVSVVLSVVFLALQVQQSNRQARVSFASDLQDSLNGWHELLVSVPGAADLMVLPDSALTRGELLQRRSLITYLFNVWLTAHIAWENGLLMDLEYEGYINDARPAATSPMVVQIMRDMLGRYPGSQDFPIFAAFRDVP